MTKARQTQELQVRLTRILLLAVLLLPMTSRAETSPGKFKYPNVAIAVFPQSEAAKSLANGAQSRLEQILLDNNATVMDRDEAEKLKKGWKQLEDPGYLITADDFVNNAAKYHIDAIVRIYLTADTAQPIPGAYSATAQADVRIVGADASVDAKTSFPMGGPGRPPSDGLTQQAALINAMQRAVDEAATGIGLAIAEPASPRALAFKLDGPTLGDAGAEAQTAAAPLDTDSTNLAKLFQETWHTEKVSCTSKAPGGELGLVGGSVSEMARGDPFVHHGSRIHIVDLAQKREIATYDTQAVARQTRDQRGTSSLLACGFVSSWRYVAAVTGDYLTLFDVERGLQLDRVLLPFGLSNSARIEVLTSSKGLLIRVDGDNDSSKIATYTLVVLQKPQAA